MPKVSSRDLRQRVVDDVAQGHSDQANRPPTIMSFARAFRRYPIRPCKSGQIFFKTRTMLTSICQPYQKAYGLWASLIKHSDRHKT